MAKITLLFIAWVSILIFVISLTIYCGNSHAVDRCNDYVIDVRNAHIMYLGPDYPYWYGLGQLRQESRCRNVSAWDGGQGIAQFMPKTAESIEKLMGENLSPNNPEQAVKMQAFYMSYIQKKENWTKDKLLWISYQTYNGGRKNLYSEYLRAGKLDHDSMRSVCKRKVAKLKSGQLLDFCDVNYEYSLNIYKYGQVFKKGEDLRKYWR